MWRRSLSTVEAFLDGLLDEGFGDDGAVAAYRGFTSFLLGHLLLEVSSLGADVGPLDVKDDGEQRNAKPMVFPTATATPNAAPRSRSSPPAAVIQPAARASRRWKWCTPASRAGE